MGLVDLMFRLVLQEGDQSYMKLMAQLNDVLLVLSGAPIQHEFLSESSPRLICPQLVWLALLILGFIVPSVVVYNVELTSRIAYISNRHGGRSSWRASEWHTANWIQLSVYFMIGVSGLWSLSLLMVSIGQNIMGGYAEPQDAAAG